MINNFGLIHVSANKQLNHLIGFLDKGGAIKDGLGSREGQALRTIRAKRDADEAGSYRLYYF